MDKDTNITEASNTKKQALSEQELIKKIKAKDKNARDEKRKKITQDFERKKKILFGFVSRANPNANKVINALYGVYLYRDDISNTRFIHHGNNPFAKKLTETALLLSKINNSVNSMFYDRDKSQEAIELSIKLKDAQERFEKDFDALSASLQEIHKQLSNGDKK